ncbi:DNA-binding transcriptional MerR regulator [Microbacterium sp. AG1240]|uniref:MerR family transcriptional regulator n=1 Tax=Microbacterium sp. AG1240 TaxID=2183992 RepID=UPI000EB588E2|nr:MerR family transcriptional regulator [Microbacterium sp. AG1240]RKT37180.1 DNA-binding transcriptional MerR regulator [Microbacterium sp. AG1240]
MDASDARDGERIGTVARRLGVSVRTLHHWDALGVAGPSGRSANGYRSYLPADVARLRRVLLFRELGVALHDVSALLTADAAKRRAELARRRSAIVDKIAELQNLVDDVDRLVAADREGVLLDEAEQTEVFGAAWDSGWSAAAREMWGDTAQWAEYSERSAGRSADDWRDVTGAMNDAIAALAAAKRRGIVPGSDTANVLAERHRAALGEYFHCTVSMHVLVARRYVTEPGFAATFDDEEPGLAAWVGEVVEANARAHGVDPATANWE